VEVKSELHKYRTQDGKTKISQFVTHTHTQKIHLSYSPADENNALIKYQHTFPQKQHMIWKSLKNTHTHNLNNFTVTNIKSNWPYAVSKHSVVW